MYVCSEAELEEVLTMYTRLSRSASVFLRSSSRPISATVASRPPPSSSSSSVSPVKGQDSLSSGKPRAKDQSGGESHARHSSVDRNEGVTFLQ